MLNKLKYYSPYIPIIGLFLHINTEISCINNMFHMILSSVVQVIFITILLYFIMAFFGYSFIPTDNMLWF